MKPVSPILFYDHCYGNYAIAAVNIFTMEQVHGLFSAAQETATPIIVQITPAARNYASPIMLMHMINAAAAIYPKVLYAIHLDHGIEEHIEAALNEEYTSVMIDASHDVFKINVKRTKAIVDKAHVKNIVVEAELGVLSGVEDDLTVDDSQAKYTNPEQAKEFVSLTGCDSLAVAVGTSHGAYKFSGKQGLQFDVLEKISTVLPQFPLVLHGSSSVNLDDVRAINQNGGRLNDNASGVTDDELVTSISYGICKVNIATDLRLLWTKIHRKFFHEHPDQFDPTTPGKEYMKAYKDFMMQRFTVLGCYGKSPSINLN